MFNKNHNAGKRFFYKGSSSLRNNKITQSTEDHHCAAYLVCLQVYACALKDGKENQKTHKEE